MCSGEALLLTHPRARKHMKDDALHANAHVLLCGHCHNSLNFVRNEIAAYVAAHTSLHAHSPRCLPLDQLDTADVGQV